MTNLTLRMEYENINTITKINLCLTLTAIFILFLDDGTLIFVENT